MSSPIFPQSNGQVERMVQTVKAMLKQSPDLHLPGLSYVATLMPWCGWSPAEPLMGRRVQTTVPQAKEHFISSWSYISEFKQVNAKFKRTQKKDFDKHHRV